MQKAAAPVYLCRMPADRLVKTVLLGSVDGIRQRGRPPKKWTDRQHHGVDWPDTVPGCSAVRRSFNMERDCIWPQRFLTKEHEEEEEDIIEL